MRIINLLSTILIFQLCIATHCLAQYTPDSIHTAARSGNTDILLEHINKGVRKDTLNNALGAAVVGQQLEAIELLHTHGADINHLSSYNTHLLNNAIMLNFNESAKKLIELGADTNIYGFKRKERNYHIDWNWTPLMCAAYQGNFELVELLLNYNADSTLKGWSHSPNDIESAADIAAYRGHVKVLKLLLKNGSPLHQETIFKTARGGHLKSFKYLLKKEKDKNMIGRNNKTLLMEASWWGRSNIVKFLLKKKADVNFVNSQGSTALIEVVSNPDRNLINQLVIVKILVDNGADINISVNGKTATDIAQKNNKKNIVQYLSSKKQHK